MRSLILALNILAGVSLLTTADNVFAAYGSVKAGKNQHHGKHSVGHTKKKESRSPGDIWQRIRSGMQIPRPGPEQEPAELSLMTESDKQLQAMNQANSVLAPAPTQVRIHKRTGQTLQLDKINALIAAATIAGHDSKISETDPQDTKSTQKINTRSNIASEPMRFRTVIGFHPELHKHDVKRPLERVASAPVITGRIPTTVNVVKSIAPSLRCIGSREQGLAESGQPSQPADKRRELEDPCHATQASHYQRVNKQIAWYAQRPDYLRQVAERARPYIYHIVEKLSKNKLPLELALLPIVESAYQPTALSAKSAAGLWQFIPDTGNDFELEQSESYDERLDITASTEAAIRFLSRLKQHFNGDWLLALAAYNCGQGAVDAAISRNVAEGLPTDFWSLPLPEETRNYVPRLLALSSIFANPANYHLKLPSIRNEQYFVKVRIDHHNDVKHLAGKSVAAVAQLADLSVDKFSLLNPGFRSATLPTSGAFTFLMPAENADRLHKGLATLARVSTDMQKKEPSFSTVMSALTVSRLPKFSAPFLSLDMSGSQTAPRRANHDLSGIL